MSNPRGFLRGWHQRPTDRGHLSLGCASFANMGVRRSAVGRPYTVYFAQCGPLGLRFGGFTRVYEGRCRLSGLVNPHHFGLHPFLACLNSDTPRPWSPHCAQRGSCLGSVKGVWQCNAAARYNKPGIHKTSRGNLGTRRDPTQRALCVCVERINRSLGIRSIDIRSRWRFLSDDLSPWRLLMPCETSERGDPFSS